MGISFTCNLYSKRATSSTGVITSDNELLELSDSNCYSDCLNNLCEINDSNMCSKAVIFVVLCVVVDLAAGFSIRDKPSKKEDLSASLRTLAGYRKRLQAQGLIPNVEQHDSQDVRNFDELELLQLIPVTIKQLRHDLLTAEERRSLHNIFGEMWTLMVEDSRRKRSEPRDAVLSVLLNSREVRLGKKDVNQKFQNDLEGNSIQKVYKPEDAKTVQLSDDLTVDPPQRILRMVAAIVQKAYKDLAARRPTPTPTPRKSRSKRSNSINLENVKVTIHMPRVKRSPKPSIPLKSTIGLSAEEKRRVEEANEAAIMEAVLAQIGGNNLDEDEDYEEEDYEEDEQSMSNKVTLPKLGEIEEDEGDDENDGGDDLHGAMSMPDYAYDDIAAGSDDYFSEEYKPARYSGGDFENPSVNELIMLAAKHRTTHRRSESGIRASSYRTASDEYEY